MNQVDTCYDSNLFIESKLDGLLCPIGLGVLRDPVFDACGHVFCRGCITQWLGKSKLCPLNKKPIELKSLITALPIKEMVANLQLKQCLNKNCEWKGKLDEQEYHDRECPQKYINCTNKECEFMILRFQLKDHLEVCKFTEIECPNCHLKAPRLSKHADICESRTKQCDLCQSNYFVKDTEIHQLNCEEVNIKCPVENCNEVMKRKNLNNHIHNAEHIVLLQKQIKELQLKIQIPYLEGWRLSFGKKVESREWITINTIDRLAPNFILHFDVNGLQSKPNNWRAVIGVTAQKVINHHLWYKQPNTFVWIFGGYKCHQGADKYAREIKENNFKGKVIINKLNQLIFHCGEEDLGVAYDIPSEIVQQRMYLMISFINIGKLRLIDYQPIL